MRRALRPVFSAVVTPPEGNGNKNNLPPSSEETVTREELGDLWIAFKRIASPYWNDEENKTEV